jgi:hypothetical protein
MGERTRRWHRTSHSGQHSARRWRSLRCRFLGWHHPQVPPHTGEANTCRRCGVEIIEDSQGGWF